MTSTGPSSPSAGARFTLERVAAGHPGDAGVAGDAAVARDAGDARDAAAAGDAVAGGAAAAAAGLASARYTGEIATPSVTYRADLLLREDGTFDLTWVGEAAPESMHKQLSMFAKLTARSAPARREEGVPIWPARVTRWRPTT